MAIKRYVLSVMTDRRHGPVAQAVKFILWVMSCIFGVIVRVTRQLYVMGLLPSFRSPKPVISVGNITVGGAGKTPLVIAIIKILQSRKLRAAILTRGYMPRSTKVFSDEARMLEEHLVGVPVFANPNRRQSVEECLKHHAVDAFVCDDAFQHWPLQRDLDIVAVDAVNPFGNGELLPRGILREPLVELKRAQVIVLTKTDQLKTSTEELHARVGQINPKALIVESKHSCAGFVDVYARTEQDPSHLRGITVVAFCAIGDANSFRQTLINAGLNVANVFVFMDHHVYTEEDMAMVRKYAQNHDVQMIVTTHKDAVKLDHFQESWHGFHVYYVQLELEFTQGKNAFIERILSVVRP